MDPAQIALILGIVSAAVGLVYGAMRFGRDETQKQIETSGSIVDQFKTINEELRVALRECVAAREVLEQAVVASQEACGKAVETSARVEGDLRRAIEDNEEAGGEHG